jgi:hypothetical protein
VKSADPLPAIIERLTSGPPQKFDEMSVGDVRARVRYDIGVFLVQFDWFKG